MSEHIIALVHMCSPAKNISKALLCNVYHIHTASLIYDIIAFLYPYRKKVNFEYIIS